MLISTNGSISCTNIFELASLQVNKSKGSTFPICSVRMSFRQVNEVNAAGIPPLRGILACFAARMTFGLHTSKLLCLNKISALYV